ncbi:MAG: discoidin domain-containing protein [Oceanipulchritudo sp.]
MKLSPLALLCLFAVPALAAPENVALNRPVVADSINSPETPAERAVDGDTTSTRWVSGSDPMPHWIEVELDQSYQLSQMKFWTGHSTGSYCFPNAMVSRHELVQHP